MRTPSLLLLSVVSQVDTTYGFASSSRQPTAASRMNTAAMQLSVNNDDANIESEISSSSSLSSRPSRRDVFRGSLLAGAAAMMTMIPVENAKAIDMFKGKPRIGGLADKIRGILKNMVSRIWCTGICHTLCYAFPKDHWRYMDASSFSPGATSFFKFLGRVAT